jgi:DNA-binding XRE family transcriptional regulator
MIDRMTGGELQTVREYLGLTTEAMAGILGVRHDTVRRWESGRERVPERVRSEVEQVEADTAGAVGELVAALQDARDPAVVVYRTDADLHAARPDVAHLTARWWRHVVARACTEVPGVEVGTRAELEMCDACQRLNGAGRRTAPHGALVPEGPPRERVHQGARADEQDYRCSVCGQRWMHEAGNSGYGWIPNPADVG